VGGRLLAFENSKVIGGKVDMEGRWTIGFSGWAKRELEDGREMDDRLWGGDQGHPDQTYGISK
jgi:hypothetical protein